jgi:hypothetical protein
MKSGFVVSLAAALALMIFLPTGGAGAVGVGKHCGGFPGIACDAGLYCEQTPGTCGVIDRSGVCAKPPRFCPRSTSALLKVCGCNFVTYNNDCERRQAMTSLRRKGACN